MAPQRDAVQTKVAYRLTEMPFANPAHSRSL